MPRYMLLLHGDKLSEAGKMPSKEILEQMHAYNSEMVSAGVMLSGDGLHATSKGARVLFPPPEPSDSDKPGPESDITVANGPFEYAMENPTGQSGEPKRPVCGFWTIKAENLEEAVAWVKKAPLAGTFMEIRQIFESSEFPELSDYAREQEEGWRKEMEKNK